MCDIAARQARIALDIAAQLGLAWFDDTVIDPSWLEYALLVLATDTPIDRAFTYLEDTGSPKRAQGRLLLRAAERSLRESGEVGGEKE